MQLDDKGRRVARASIGATLFVLLPAAGVLAWRLHKPARPALAAAAPAASAELSAAAAPAGGDNGRGDGNEKDLLANPVAALDRLMLNATGGETERAGTPAVPPPAGAQRIFAYGRQGSQYDITVYAVDSMGAIENARAHRKRLEGAGFKVQSPEVGPKRVTMVATRGGLRAMVVVVGESAAASTTSIVTTGGDLP